MASKKTVSLVLGSGGARGLAHIGIIHWLEENDYEIRSISGCSMGALVGGIYAAGELDEFEKWVRAVTKTDMVRLLDLALGTDGLFKGHKIMDTLKEMVGEKRIEDLPVKYTAVAANISRSREVWIDRGSLFDAIRASIAMPVFFTPHPHKGEDLIDGGILNPVPIAPTFRDHTDLTIAVNLCGWPVKGAEDELRKMAEEMEKENGSASPVADAVADFFGKVRDSLPSTGITIRAYDIVHLSFEAMQESIARQKIAAYPPDYVLELPKNVCKMLEFDKAAPLIKYGYDTAKRVLDGQLDEGQR